MTTNDFVRSKIRQLLALDNGEELLVGWVTSQIADPSALKAEFLSKQLDTQTNLTAALATVVKTISDLQK